MSRGNKIRLLGGAATISVLAAIAFAEPAFAQSAAELERETEAQLTADTIIVTARRREEALKDVPLSVTVTPGDQLTTGRTNSLEDLAEATPNVVFNPQAGPITIRGVGSLGIDGGLERQLGVGIFLDEVYIRRPNSFPIFLDDLERAEIVRGSQSTLYGENTIGGAINLISRKPGDEFGGDLELSLGSLDYVRVRGGVDIPLGEKLKTRGFITYTKRDGYIENSTTGVDQGTIDNLGGRFIAALDLGADTEATLILDYDRTDDDAGIPFSAIDLAFAGQSVNDFPSIREVERGGATLRIEHNFGEIELLSISGYRAYDYLAQLDGDFSAGAFLFQEQEEDQSQFSQELRLSSDTGEAFSWRLGTYYLHEDFEGSQAFDFLGLPAGTESRNFLDQTADVFAVYGEALYQFTDRLEATAGLRYTRETRDGRAEITSASGSFFFGPEAVVSDKETFDEFLPEFSLSYRASPSTILYGRVARGFKAGGVSQFIDVNDTANVFEPETSWSYEIGSKSSTLDDRLQLNFALFYIDWKNQQARISITPTIRVVRNAAESSSYGGEAELIYRPTDALQFNLGYGYLEAEYDSFEVPFLGQDFSGIDQQYAPHHSLSAGYKWEQGIGADLTVFSSAAYNYRSSYRFDPAASFRQPETHILDAEIGIAYGNVALSVWGKNLVDEAFLKGFFDFGPGGLLGVAAEDRTWGATLKARF
ncbi:MAG: TonB-dependent receptor [Pseudomonadota bacterium]